MRAILKRCHITKEIVLLLDFINAFNRNLLLLLTAAYVPELTKLVAWFYKNESDLMTSTDDVVTSSTGTQQGCALSSPLFDRFIGYLNARLKKKGLTKKLRYMDDGALHGTHESVEWAARERLERWETKQVLGSTGQSVLCTVVLPEKHHWA